MLKKSRKRVNQNLLDFFIGRPRYRKNQISIEMMNLCCFQIKNKIE